MRSNETKLLSFLIISLFVGVSFISGISAHNSLDDDTTKKIIFIRINDSSKISFLESPEINILETYEQGFLIEIGLEQIEQLNLRDDIFLELLQHREYVGLHSYAFNVKEGTPEIPKQLELFHYPEGASGYYIIQFIGPIKLEWLDELIELGVRPHEFRHRFNFIVEMDSNIRNDVELFNFVNWVGIYQPAYKVDSSLLAQTGSFTVEVSLFESEDLINTALKIENLGGTITQTYGNRLHVMIDSESIPSIAHLHNVKSITKATEEYYIFNDDATWITQTNEQNNRKVTEAGITGSGQIITVMDSELYGGNSNNPDHEMWADPDGNPVGEDHRKILEHYVPATAGGDLNAGVYHGTHVVGSVLGDSPPYDEYSNRDGNALGAQLIFQDVDHDSSPYVSLPDDMYTHAWVPSYESGSRTHTNSIGGGSGYGGISVSGDQFIWNHKDYTILYAMGNSGPSSNSLSQQAEGKNIISVGGVTNYPQHNTMYSSSSRGYANDGRIKPTVLHVAQYVSSASRSTSGYSTMSGTSMSTPGLAGQVGQVRQYYEDGWYPHGFSNPADGFNPSNALIRATIINGAVEITGSGAYQNDNRFPNGDQGYGRSKLDRVLHVDGDERNLIVFDSWNDGIELNTGESWEMNFVVIDPDQEVEVTLAWSDYPGSSGANQANPAIVNDLDLEVVAPDGTRYVGNAFTGFNPGYSEPNPTSNPWNGLRTGEFDGLNVDENILLLPEFNGVQEGIYEVTVSAHQVSQGSQPFALVVSGGIIEEIPGEPPSITLVSPDSTDEWNADTVEDITWTTEPGDDPIDRITLWYSTNHGSSWTLIETGIADLGSYSWTIPNVHSSQCLIRARVIDEAGRIGEDISESFTIEGIPPAPPDDLMVHHVSSPVMALFDDFSDGTSDGWTEYDGPWDASEGYLQGHGSISIPGQINEQTIDAYGRWEFDFQLQQISSAGGQTQSIRAHFIQIDDSDTRESSGYYAIVTGETGWWDEGQINLWRWDDGSTPGSTVISSSWNPNTNINTLAVERDENGVFRMYLNDNLQGSASDTTYTTNEYLGFRHSPNLGSGGDHIIHEIRVEVLGEGDDHNLLTWTASPDDPSEVSEYRLYRSEQQGGPWESSTFIGSVSAVGSSSYQYVDEFKGLADDVFWWYVIRAVGKNGLEEDNEYAVQEPFDGFSLLLSTSGDGSGSIEACWLGPFYYEDEVTVWANASEGSIFEGFSGDLSGILSPQTLVITGNMSVDAAFSLQSGFTLSLSTSGDGSGSIEAAPFGPYTYGDEVLVWANASEGSVFVGFSGDLSGSSSPQVLMITGNMSVDAAFEVGVEVVDVEQELSDRGFRLMPGWDAAQEFISSYPTLSRVELYMTTWNDPVHPIPVEIRKDDPIGDVLFSSVIYPADVATSFPDWGWVSVDVGVAVEVGETYVIVLRDSADDDFNHLMWGVYTSFGAPPGPYPDGQMLFRKLGFPTWMPIWDFDCAFKTYGLI